MDVTMIQTLMNHMAFSKLSVLILREKTPIKACSVGTFCCNIQKEGRLDISTLKLNHPYYAQVQGQMAVGKCKWCNFVIYTRCVGYQFKA